MLALYTYFRSSAAYRVRIALHLKGLPWQALPVHLLKGEQHHPDYRALSPLGAVPALDTGEGILTQSLAIIEWLEETHPLPALLPADPAGRARVRAIAQTIACDIHPLGNLRVLNYLVAQYGLDNDARTQWIRHWVGEGLAAVEQLLDHPGTGAFCHGDSPGLADCCLIPQLFNARRYACPLEGYPLINRIAAACEALPAFRDAAPDRQLDAQ